MDKLITVDHALRIVDVLGCKKCKKQTDRGCPSDCEILNIKYKLSQVDADAVLVAIMEMPKENEILVFDMWHGKIYTRSTSNIGKKFYEVISLPEGHGRLIDADALKENLRTVEFWNGSEQIVSEQDINDAPIIVPAE